MATGAYFGVNTESISYNVLSYIQSDGNQYIDTGFKPNQNTKLVIDLQPNLPVYDEENFNTWWYTPFGTYTWRNNDDVSSFDICIENEGSKWSVNWSTDDPYGDTGTGYEVFSYTNNKRIAISLEKTKVTLDGDTRNWTTANIQSDVTLYLFAEHCFNTDYSPPYYADYHTPMKLYSCQIYDNGTLVRDFVPCISSDNKVGLYDRIGGKFYSNVGSGTFTAGSLTGEEISSDGSTDNIARKIKNIYIGIDNKARKVKKAYIGIGGKARLFYSSFPAEPTEYTLVNTYSSSTTYTATEDGYYKIILQGPSGNGGKAAWYGFDSTDGYYYQCLGSGGGGGGAGCAISIVKMNKGDSVIYNHANVGNQASVYINSSIETYSNMLVSSGSNGGDGYTTRSDITLGTGNTSGGAMYIRGGAGGAGGIANGGQENYNGGVGSYGEYDYENYKTTFTMSGGAGGAAGYSGGRSGGTGGSATHTANKQNSTAYSGASGSASFMQIYRGNTNV